MALRWALECNRLISPVDETHDPHQNRHYRRSPEIRVDRVPSRRYLSRMFKRPAEAESTSLIAGINRTEVGAYDLQANCS
jgi:hypothetical protein